MKNNNTRNSRQLVGDISEIKATPSMLSKNPRQRNGFHDRARKQEIHSFTSLRDGSLHQSNIDLLFTKGDENPAADDNNRDESLFKGLDAGP